MEEESYIIRATEIADKFASDNRINNRSRLLLRLAAEEISEMARLLNDEPRGRFTIEGDNKKCVLKLSFPKPGEPEAIPEGGLPEFKSITEKIGFLLKSSYETLGSAEDEVRRIGVQKEKERDLKESGLEEYEGAYVWTMDSYSFTSFDRYEESGERDWIEISRSIIASISDDVRIFVLPERTELIVKMSFDRKKKDIRDKYNIHPELKQLYRIPVAKSRFQIKLVQLMYRKLPDKQRSTDEYRVIRHRIPCSASPKGVINTLEYCPAEIDQGEKTPAVVFFHGGAYLFPALPYHYRLAAIVAERTGARVFLPMYDLAPKYNPPTQIKEGLEIYSYLLSERDRFGIDSGHVAVMGDSSGGTISAAVSLLTRDKGIQLPAGQALLYPSLDTRGNTKSMERFTDVPVVNSDAIRSYMKIIRSDREEGVKYYTSPAEAGSFEGLPPAYIETAEFDALHDEGTEYAAVLRNAGCNVILNETKGTVHSYDMAKDSSVLKDALKKRTEFLNSVLHG